VAREAKKKLVRREYTKAHEKELRMHSRAKNSILLTKPFAPAQLVTAVSQLLNTGSPIA
jgi:hypothetical protein